MNFFRNLLSKVKLPVFKSKKVRNIVVAGILAVCIGAGGAIAYFSKGKKVEQEINTAVAALGNIRVTVSGSGTLQAIESYEVKANVSGDVLSCTFEEGDQVEKDQVLYTIDTTEMQNTIERAELSMEKTRNSYNTTMENVENLNIKAPIDGVITNMYVQEGDNVNNGTKICDLIDTSKMVLTIPFNQADSAYIYNGASAKVTLDNSFYETEGRVTRVSTGSITNENNVSVVYVDIEVANPGGISEGTTATAVVGEVACNSSGTFTCKAKKTVTAEVAGEIKKVYNGMGDKMYAGGIIAQIESSNLDETVKNAKNSLRDAELSLQNTYDKLEDYTIKAPISGTVLYKQIKAGDTIDNISSASTMCYIADLSSIVFSISVDELDISKIEKGQTVEITADAVENRRYTGKVSKVSVTGSTANGVTTYPVEITLDNATGLIPGMNVNAEIIIEQRINALVIPVSAVQRGNIVYVKGEPSVAPAEDSKEEKKSETEPEKSENKTAEDNTTPSEKTEESSGNGERPQGNFGNGERPQGGFGNGERPQGNFGNGERPQGNFGNGERPQGGFGGMRPQNGEEAADKKTEETAEKSEENKEAASGENTEKNEKDNASESKGGNASAGGFGNREEMQKKMLEAMQKNAPEGFTAVIVTTGASDENNIEILSGLSEGDEVYIRTSFGNGGATQTMPGGMGGGMGGFGGGMSGGGMSGGGFSGGNMGGNRSFSGGGNMGSNRSFGGGMR